MTNKAKGSDAEPITSQRETAGRHLWEVDHPYYCNEGNYYAPGNDQPYCEYESWSDFITAEGDSDFDMNLLFRWDWRKADPKGEHWGNQSDTLWLFWMGQRKGLYRWTEITVTDADEPDIREWLSRRWDHLVLLWEGIALSRVEVDHG